MPVELTQSTLPSWVAPGARIYWPGCAGHSALFERWFEAEPELAAGRWFCGMWIPTVNRFDPTALHPQARATSFFLPSELHAGWQRGALDLLPLHYSEAWRYLGSPGRFDLVLLQVAPPDDQGRCSLSLAADFSPAVLAALGSGAVLLAHVNPLLPRTCGPSVPVSRIQAWVHAAEPLLQVPPEPVSPGMAQVARQVASMVRDGDTVQLGLGRLQAAVLQALKQHRGLRLHAGMVSDGLLDLADAGALAAPEPDRPPVMTGVALGTDALYERVADPDLVRFAPVGHTHAQATLAAIPRLVAINSALQIDLLGQAQIEMLHGRQISGVGGLLDFMRGARASPGGRALLAAPSTVQAGAQKLSRVVPLLPAGSVGVTRHDADLVVTEHGVADLRQLGVDGRAQALIAIAAPEHREGLEMAWHTLRRAL